MAELDKINPDGSEIIEPVPDYPTGLGDATSYLTDDQALPVRDVARPDVQPVRIVQSDDTEEIRDLRLYSVPIIEYGVRPEAQRVCGFNERRYAVTITNTDATKAVVLLNDALAAVPAGSPVALPDDAGYQLNGGQSVTLFTEAPIWARHYNAATTIRVSVAEMVSVKEKRNAYHGG